MIHLDLEIFKLDTNFNRYINPSVSLHLFAHLSLVADAKYSSRGHNVSELILVFCAFSVCK